MLLGYLEAVWHLTMCFFLLQFDEQKDEVVIERILRVIFLNAERPTPVS